MTGRNRASRGMEEKNMKKNRIGKALHWAAAILMTGRSVLYIGATEYAYREMRHEGLTYSQWYEGAIDGFYGMLMLAIPAVSLCAVVWYFLLRKRRTQPVQRSRMKKNVSRALACAFAVLTAVLFAAALKDKAGIARAAAENAECLAPYIESYGQSRVAALLSLEALLLSLTGVRG